MMQCATRHLMAIAMALALCASGPGNACAGDPDWKPVGEDVGRDDGIHGNPLLALSKYRNVYERLSSQLPMRVEYVAQTAYNIGQMCLQLRRPSEAACAFSTASALLPNSRVSEVDMILFGLKRAAHEVGFVNTTAPVSIWTVVLDREVSLHGDQHQHVVAAHEELGRLKCAGDDVRGGIQHMRTAVRVRKQQYGSDKQGLVVSLSNLAFSLMCTKEAPEAWRVINEALDILAKSHDVTSFWQSECFSTAGEIALKVGKYKEAMSFGQRVYSMEKVDNMPDFPNPTWLKGVGLLIRACEARGDRQGAAKYLAELKPYGPFMTSLALHRKVPGTDEEVASWGRAGNR